MCCGWEFGKVNVGCAPGNGRSVDAYIRIRFRTGVDPFRSFSVVYMPLAVVSQKLPTKDMGMN